MQTETKKLDKYPETIAYCEKLVPIGYAYVYTYQTLGASACMIEEQILKNHIFGQYHKDYSEKMK